MNDTIREMFAMTKGELAKMNLPIATGEPFIVNYSREEKLRALCSLGTLTPEEAETYKDAPAELPADKKALIVNYFLLNIYDENTAARRSPFSETFAKIPYAGTLFERSQAEAKNLNFLQLHDISMEEGRALLKERRINYYYRCAQTFVGALRNRFNACFMPFMRMNVAAVLSKGERTDKQRGLSYGKILL